mmetsp:Transcript_9515/g.25875  ORF Transcript_9515/g.25875 Transcript_9515/m.25875 type:complete len:142 (-) Transcript_9515:1022-1447(-)
MEYKCRVEARFILGDCTALFLSWVSGSLFCPSVSCYTRAEDTWIFPHRLNSPRNAYHQTAFTTEGDVVEPSITYTMFGVARTPEKCPSLRARAAQGSITSPGSLNANSSTQPTSSDISHAKSSLEHATIIQQLMDERYCLG